MAAFRNAVRLGVDQLEADVRLTADGELVMIHDDRLERTTDCTGQVAATTLARLLECDAAYWWSPGQHVTRPDPDADHPLRGRGVRVPTVAQLLEYAAGLGDDGPELSLEIKNIPGEGNFDPVGQTVAAQLVPLIRATGMRERVIVQSFFPTSLEAVKRLDPGIRTQFLTSSATGQTAAQNVAYVIAADHDISAPDFTAPDLRAALVARAQAAGKAVIPYTPDTHGEQSQVLGLGVDGLISNWPGCTLALQGRPTPERMLPADARGTEPLDACPPAAAPLPERARPDAATCRALRPARHAPAQGHAAPDAPLRVFAIQYRQTVANVTDYAAFRTAMRCLMEDFVVPHRVPGQPTLVVFPEFIGLMTAATGSRGALVRQQAEGPLRAPLGDQAPAGVAAALGLLNTAYAPQIAAYQAMFGPIDPRKQVLVAAADTFARAFSQTFADIARDYGVYVVASNAQPRYRESRDPVEVALFADPDLPDADTAYVATSPRVANTTFLWGPEDVAPNVPYGERNLLFRNDKVPLTELEATFLALDEGPASGPAARVNAAGVEVAGFRLGFATSLPAFAWGYAFGERPADLAPCDDVRITYMPCMDALGVDVVIQAEANPARWAGPGADSPWQPLEWMRSSWRTVAEPTVGFDYNITAWLTGNLLDIVFDGQSSITGRGALAAERHYVGNGALQPGDPEDFAVYAGPKREFVALAPWVVADDERDTLRRESTRMAPGSGHLDENRYLQTALYADLTRR